VCSDERAGIIKTLRKVAKHMNTCKYCGTQLEYIGSDEHKAYFKCDYCDLSFDHTEVCKDRKRNQDIPDSYNELDIYMPTKKLLKQNPLVLFHLLKECRKQWYSLLKTLQNVMDLEEVPEGEEENLDDIVKPLYKEYVYLTKQKFVIENILLEKAGFVPDKITDEFLGSIVAYSRSLAEKPMYIYIKNKNEKQEVLQ
jgi:transcription elongation factor Elf1